MRKYIAKNFRRWPIYNILKIFCTIDKLINYYLIQVMSVQLFWCFLSGRLFMTCRLIQVKLRQLTTERLDLSRHNSKAYNILCGLKLGTFLIWKLLEERRLPQLLSVSWGLVWDTEIVEWSIFGAKCFQKCVYLETL